MPYRGLALALRLRDEGQEPPAGCILLSPWLDLGRGRRAVPDLVRRDVLLSPDWLGACARMWHDFALQPGLLAAADSALAQASWSAGKVTAGLPA